MRYLKMVWKDISELKMYLYSISILFLLSIIIGILLQPRYGEFYLGIIQGILDSLAVESGIGVIRFIIWNNLRAAFLGIVLGVFFGLFPLFATIVNGLIVGAVLRMAAVENPVSLWRILPHGVFELPAILIAFSMGVKLGAELFSKDWRTSLNSNSRRAARIFAFVILPLLLLAGLIEGLLLLAGM